MATSDYMSTLNGYKIKDKESIHSLSVSGKTITITKGDGTTSTITTQDTVCTCKIENGVITIEGNTITPLVATSTLDATKLSGTVPLSCIPAAALERCVVVADDTARKALTTANVQNGDTVKVTGTGKMYFVKDDTKLSSDAGYEEYAAGTAASVAWSGITGVPNYAGSDSKGGSATSAAKLDSNAGSATQPVYFANGVPVATTYTLAQSVTADSKLTDHITTATDSGTGNVVTAVSADANGALTVTKGNALTSASTLDATKLSGTIPASCYTNTTYTNGTGLTLTGTTFSANAMSAASATAAGSAGMVPAPAAGDNVKFLRGDASWADIGISVTDDGNENITIGLATN